eukprot:6041376-Pleurochrysis_carterae.AAC.1
MASLFFTSSSSRLAAKCSRELPPLPRCLSLLKWTPARIAASESAGSAHNVSRTTRPSAPSGRSACNGRWTASMSLMPHVPAPSPP